MESNCVEECQWYYGRGNDTNQEPLNKTMLFTREFCHPMPGMNMTDYNSWVACPSDASRENCPSTCAYTIGAEMIPNRPFCAP
jgi:hypothetical protein